MICFSIVACLKQQKASRPLRKKQGYQNTCQLTYVSRYVHSMDRNNFVIGTYRVLRDSAWTLHGCPVRVALQDKS